MIILSLSELSTMQTILFWFCCWYGCGILVFILASIIDWYRGYSLTIRNIIEYLILSFLGIFLWVFYLIVFLDSNYATKVVIKGRKKSLNP